jgi:hypothetical protein
MGRWTVSGDDKSQSYDVLRIIELIARIITPLLAVTLAALLGYSFYGAKQRDTEKDQYINIVRSYIQSEDEEVRYLGSIMLVGLKNENLMRKELSAFLDDENKRKSEKLKEPGDRPEPREYDRLNIKMASFDRSTSKTAPQDVIRFESQSSFKDDESNADPASSPKKKSDRAWVYLGRFDQNVKIWNKQLFDFLDQTPPEELIEKNIKTIEEETQVWANSPDLFGIKGELRGILKQGSEVTVTEIKNWANAGYYWAKVAYQVKVP